MTVGQLLYVLRDAINYLDAHGQILANGSVDFANVQNDLGFAAAIEESLKNHGVTVPGAVDQIMAIVKVGATFIK